MHITIYDLVEDKIDDFISQDTDRYSCVISVHPLNHTVDLLINVNAVAVGDYCMIIEFPNKNTLVVDISSNYYHKIEVM